MEAEDCEGRVSSTQVKWAGRSPPGQGAHRSRSREEGWNMVYFGEKKLALFLGPGYEKESSIVPQTPPFFPRVSQRN